MTKEQLKQRLKECHEREDALNKELSRCHNLILVTQDRKRSLARKISKNMIYCNSLIKRINE
jgi:hypothetical protein